MKTLSKVVTFHRQIILCILNKNSGVIPSILCYVPLSVQLLGLTASQFFNPEPMTPRFQTRFAPLLLTLQQRGKFAA